MACAPETKRGQAREATRQAVIVAAREAFRKHGFEGAHVRDIAASIGRSTGAVFGSFATKEELFEEAMGRKAPMNVIKDMLRQAHLYGFVPPLGGGAAFVLLNDLFGENADAS